MKLHGARVLLTGASGGIGSEILGLLLADGARVAVTARSADAFASLAVGPDRLQVLVGDLGEESFRARIPGLVTAWAGGLDVLVNAAGSGSFALLEG
jgi:NAD(P)-dependent dehydrogenase (short-subunit alcohol dehydrogenase family)